jgi:hypothetical protein
MLNRSIGTPAGYPTATQPPKYNMATEIYPAGSMVCGTDMAKAAAMEIITKYWRGEETPSVVGWQLTWSSFYFFPQALNPGGYVEDPMLESTPQFPMDFWSTKWPPSPTETIFDSMAVWNPQCYANDGTLGGVTNISWRREADQIDYERTWYRVQRRWVGSPVGFWDPHLYTQNDRPKVYTDYHLTKVI